MKMTRRRFLRDGSFAMAGAWLAIQNLDFLTQFDSDELVGLQLYSVRDDMQKDPAGTLKKLSDMGYRFVEHANYVDRKFYGYSAADFKKLLTDLGMRMPSGHTSFGAQHWDPVKKDFTDSWKYLVEDAATAGQELVISPWLDEKLRTTSSQLKSFMDVFNKNGEYCKQAGGMRFGYHNHDFEFSQKLDGETVYDIMLSNTDPDLVVQQLDIGNLYNGGAVAADIVAKYPNRFLSLHVKDEIKGTGHEEYESTILGKGIVHVKDVVDTCRKGGSKHFIIEQESYQGMAPVDCMKENLAIMKKWGY